MIPKNVRLISSILSASGLFSLATIAMSAEVVPTPVANPSTPTSTISDGSVLTMGGISITPIKGWNVEPRSSGMTLVMKEVTAADKSKPVDYTQPVFARNITLMTLPQGSPIDEQRASDFQQDYLKIVSKDPSLKDFQFTSHKSFGFKGENDGLVFFSQLTVNSFPMMQMHILVSNEEHQYLLTYTDLTSHFATPESYDAAWKSMTSITINGNAPVRYMHEAKIGGMAFGGFLLVMIPLMFARYVSNRRLRLAADELDQAWDSGRDHQDDDFTASNVELLDQTRVAGRLKKSGRNVDLQVSKVTSQVLSGVQEWVVS